MYGGNACEQRTYREGAANGQIDPKRSVIPGAANVRLARQNPTYP